MQIDRLIRGILLLAFGLAVSLPPAAAAESPVATPPDSVRLPVHLFLPPAAEAPLGGPDDAGVVLTPDLPLLQHILLTPTDLREATLQFTLPPAGAGLADVLARGQAGDGDRLAFADQPSLQTFELAAGSQVAITVWRHQYHWGGGADLQGLELRRIGDDKTDTSPVFLEKATQTTDLGTWRLGGISRRDQFPRIGARGEVAAGAEPGSWTVTDGSGVNLSSSKQGLKFFTWGRQNENAAFDWAPVLTFTPKVAGKYRLRGTLTFTSGQASDPKQAHTLSWMVLRTQGAAPAPVAAQLAAYRLLRAPGAAALKTGPGALVAGRDYDPQPVATAPLAGLDHGKPVTIRLEGLAPTLTGWLADPASAHGLWLKVVPATSPPNPPAGPLPQTRLSADGWGGEIVLRHVPAQSLFENPLHPRPGVFARVRDGHLFYGDDRLRLWGVVGTPDPGRLQKMGFNAERLWLPRAEWMYDAESAKRGEVKPFVKNDNSPWDQADRHFAEMKQAGMFIMFAATTGTIPAAALTADDSFVAGGADWPQWQAAMRQPQPDDYHWIFVDERLQTARKRHLKNLLTHVNPYTGKAYGQDEAIVIYEIFNENGGAQKLLEGGYEKWPAYFHDKLQKRWNDWLTARYKTADALTKAWGKLAPGETWTDGGVKLGPALQQRGPFPAARGDDFVHFILDLIDGFHQEMRATCRSFAPAGVGVNVAPFSFDTQYRPNKAWSFLQSRGDVNSPGMYFWDLESTLTRPPGAYVIDSNTLDNCATVLYETNTGRPDPYRSEYPLKVAALAGWQDWDGVFWHYWTNGGGAVDEAYLNQPLAPPTADTNYWNAVQHQVDPVMCSSMAIAGRMFLEHRLASAPKPPVITIGADALYSYDHYAGVDQAQATFHTGSRVRFEPDKPGGITVDGHPLPAPERIAEAVTAGDQIVWDWPHGRLIIDAPTAKAYVGKIDGPYKFKDGIVLGDVGTPFVVFSMVSADNKPLTGPDASQRIYLTAVWDAKNTGFEMDWTVKGGPVEQARAIRNIGTTPVVVDAVPFSVWFPTQIEGRFAGYDFALRQAVDQPVHGTNRITHAGATLFMQVLTIESRGPAAEVPTVTAAAATPAVGQDPGHPMGAGGAGAAGGEPGAARAKNSWNPIPGVAWSGDYAAVYQTLQQSKLKYTSISPRDSASPTTAADKSIVLSGLQLASLWQAAADIEFAFHANRLSEITVTFKQPPPFADAVADYQKQFGAPVEKRFAAQFETSVARWPAQADRPAITLTESQGIFKILYAAPKP